jgi:hypothetical protein
VPVALAGGPFASDLLRTATATTSLRMPHRRLGARLEQCDHCSQQSLVFHSCRNRACPKCQSRARDRWLARTARELLPKGFVKIRHFGFLAHPQRRSVLPRASCSVRQNLPSRFCKSQQIASVPAAASELCVCSDGSPPEHTSSYQCQRMSWSIRPDSEMHHSRCSNIPRRSIPRSPERRLRCARSSIPSRSKPCFSAFPNAENHRHGGFDLLFDLFRSCLLSHENRSVPIL